MAENKKKPVKKKGAKAPHSPNNTQAYDYRITIEATQIALSQLSHEVRLLKNRIHNLQEQNKQLQELVKAQGVQVDSITGYFDYSAQ